MKEENNGASKNKWSRIFRKKWFFPAMYLTIAAVLLTVVVWYQNLDNQIPEVEDDQEVTEDYTPNPYDEDAESVVGQQEIIRMPVEDQDQAEIVTKFFDYNADQEDQENALILYNNRYYQSTGIDIAAANGEAFSVTASLSGTVTEVKEDPLLGNVVTLSHDNDVVTYYASLGEISVKAGDDVEQGDSIGTAGKNLFGQDNGTHVHFEIRKDGKEFNPEEFFNKSVSELDSANQDANDESEAPDEGETEDPNGETEDPDQDEDQEPEADDENPADETSDSSASTSNA
ncbi:peptidoglycan DD-metalloendopeptidase family protein [Virgibacillus byunsanensis]|uniref:Peptidoglycan DD-metalloendopeptidase family protein n=1 Tax=Virgibacillus byunsanensis TaxID=570945 RepID=A0ABW3LI19_9BACI